MSSDDLADRLTGLVHRDTQLHDTGVDLTVAAIYALSGPAQVDFGGDELTGAKTSKVEPVTREPDDDYGWWHLGGGTYLVEYNESLSGTELARLQPRTTLVERGVTHPTLSVAALPRIPLGVPPAGVQLKQNARVSTLVASDPLD